MISMKSESIINGAQKCAAQELCLMPWVLQRRNGRPLIGIVSSQNDIVPGHMNIDKIVEAVKLGVAMAGGTPAVFSRYRGVRRDCNGTSGNEIFAGYPRPDCGFNRGDGNGAWL